MLLLNTDRDDPVDVAVGDRIAQLLYAVRRARPGRGARPRSDRARRGRVRLERPLAAAALAGVGPDVARARRLGVGRALRRVVERQLVPEHERLGPGSPSTLVPPLKPGVMSCGLDERAKSLLFEFATCWRPDPPSRVSGAVYSSYLPL